MRATKFLFVFDRCNSAKHVLASKTVRIAYPYLSASGFYLAIAHRRATMPTNTLSAEL